MQALNYLIPKPLRKLDTHLLQHYPIIWETKIHYVLFFSALVANVVLSALAFVYPAKILTYIPYETMVAQAWGWSTLAAMLAVLYYAYQQSFVRVQTYTWRQNLLRYSLYAVGVSSILFNTLTLPNLLIYRVNQVYSQAEIARDLIEHTRNQYLISLVNRAYEGYNENDIPSSFELLKKHPLNHSQSLDRIIAFQNDFKKIHLESDNKQQSIQNQTNWHPELREHLAEKLSYNSNSGFLDMLRVIDQTLALPFTQQKNQKYLPPLSYYDSRYDYRYQNLNLTSQLANLLKYKKANFWLNTFYNQEIEHNLNFENINRTLQTAISSKQLAKKIKEAYINNRLSNNELIELSKESDKLDKYIQAAWADENIAIGFGLPVAIFMTLFLSLLVLTAKIFTLKNLIISGFLMFGSLFLLMISATTEWFFIRELRWGLIGIMSDFFAIFDISFRSFVSTPLIISWLVPWLIMLFSLGLANYVRLQKINFRWVPLLWTFVLSSAMVATLATSFLLLFEKNVIRYDYLNVFVTQLWFIYPLLALAMFAMYVVYNQIALFPQKK
jgi:hypothetical protein